MNSMDNPMTTKNAHCKSTAGNNFRERETFSLEREKRLTNGNYVCYACGPLMRPRYINERIEQELIEFKSEIE
jgi:hypothetical protein